MEEIPLYNLIINSENTENKIPDFLLNLDNPT